MPLPTITAKAARDAIIASIESQTAQTVPLLSKAFSRVVATSLGGLIALLGKYNQYTFLNMFVATAKNEPTTVNGITVIPLQAWGVLVGAGLPDPATAAEHTVDFAVNNITGATIDAGTQFVGADNGVTYLSTAAVLINAATISIPMKAAGDQSNNAGVGSIGNLEVGAAVSFVTAPTGVEQDGAVASIQVTGADAESTEAYRQRILDRFQKRPQGGALVDYEVWGEEAEGIINVYPYAADCPGIVDVYAEATVASSGSADGIPTQAQLDDVLANINLDDNGRATRRQVNAYVDVYPITRKAFRVEVVGLEVADDANVKAQIEVGLAQYFRNKEPFIGGVSVIRRDRIHAGEVSGVVAQIVTAAGGTYQTVITTTQPLVSATFTGRTVANDDDAVELGGAVTVVAPTMLLGGATRYTGMRIPGVSIPPGSTITSASLTLTASSLNNTYSDFEIRGEAVDNAAAYTAAANDISSRNMTVASTQWVPDGWPAATTHESADMAAVVQEVIDVAGWAQNNPVNLIITGTDDSNREVDAFESGLAVAPLLTVNYDFESGTFAAFQVYTLGRGEKAKLDGAVIFS